MKLLSDIRVGRGLAPGIPVVHLTAIGTILRAQLQALQTRFSITIHHSVIMPNHCHILFSINGNEMPGASPRPTTHQIIGACKSLTTRLANQRESTPGRILFQSSYHDHVIRNDADFLEHWQYIESNPARWAEDEYYSV